MGGKKIDRKKQALLSRAKTRKATIKKLSFKPVLKKVDIEEIKKTFKSKPIVKSEEREISAPAQDKKSESHAVKKPKLKNPES